MSIKSLKRKARNIYLDYLSECGRYSCGITLAEHVSPRIRTLADNFNSVMEELEKIDKTMPKWERL